MTAAKILEALMLVAFGVSWPISLFKSIKAKNTNGKSILFLIIIDIGYIFGMVSKFVSTTFVWSTDWWIFMIYCINFVFVSTDLVVCLIYRNKNNKTVIQN